MLHEEFMKLVRETNERNRHPELWTEPERLCKKIMSKKDSDEEWLELEKEVIEYLKSDASEEDKREVLGYTESLLMICSAIREEKTDL
jgi:hypothetical protein